MSQDHMGELAIIALTFFVAGTTKGTIGIGPPTIAVAVLTATIGFTDAIVLSLVPSFASNAWQAVSVGHAAALLRRLWPFLLPAMLTVWVGTLALTRVDIEVLSAVLGVALAAYAGADVLGMRLKIGRAAERRGGPIVGAVNGAMTGMTGSYIVPGVMFLQAIGLERDELVQAMGLLFTLSTVALFVSLANSDLLASDQASASLLALVPTGIGMIAGRRLRTIISETTFRNATMICLLAIGVYLVVVATVVT